MNDTQERLLSALIHLADGCLQYTKDYWKAKAVTQLPATFQQGWNILVDVGLEKNIPYPLSLQDLNTYLHTPLEEWHGYSSAVDELGIQGSLLWNGLPRDLCYDLRADSNSKYLQDEIDQRKFRAVYVHCKQNNLDSTYRSVRGFIAQNPYLLHGQMEINSIALEDEWNDEIRKLVIAMYEPVPILSRFLSNSKSHIIACPRCGWTLQQTQSGEYTCYSDVCGKVYDLRFPKIEWQRQTNDLSLRAKPGIQRFIVSPEQELLVLRHQLESMGFQTELWTGVDEFDLYVQFADGVAWAIDVKDYSSPKYLADNLKSGSITPVRHWNKAFYVIPEHRRNATYLRITNRLWNNSDKRIELIYVNDFVDKVPRNIR